MNFVEKRFLLYNELKKLDFKMCDEDVILSTMWVLDCLPKGTELIAIVITGEEELDNDIRMGVTSYGFTIGQLREPKIEEVLEK